MAEKGFGVKEVNLIGASGTPTITSPNNLNLNAINVAISTNVSIGGTLSVTGNVSVGGTLTYEDVTNIDSVGLITARSGVSVTSGGIQVLAGTSRFNANIIGTATTAISVTAADESSDTSCNVLFSTAATGNVAPKTGTNLTFNSSNGTLTATTFSGSGASLTSLPAANITGTLPAISGANLTNLPADTPTNSDIQVAYTVTANGSSAYRFAGNGIVSTEDNPDVYLIRGLKYRFINNSGGSHPFQIRGSSGGSAYSSGVTNNGAASGNIDFQVPYSAPSHLYYQCTAHGGMVGNLYIRGAGGQNTNVGVTTFSGFTHIKTAVINTAYQTIESTATNSYPYLRLKNDAREYQLSCHGGQSDSFNIYDGTAGAYRFTIASNGSVSIGNNPTVHSDTIFHVEKSSGETNVKFEGNDTMGARLSLHNNNTSGTANNQINFCDAGGQSTSSIIGYNTDQTNNYGELVFATRSAQGTPPEERFRITSNGDWKAAGFDQTYACMYRSLSNSSSSNMMNSTGVMVFASATFSMGNSNVYDTSNGRYTAPIRGLYLFNVNVLVDNSYSSGAFYIKAYVDGSNTDIFYTYESPASNNYYRHVSGSHVLALNAGQYHQFYATAGAHISNETNFSACLIQAF